MNTKTKGVQLLLEKPSRSVIKLAIPIMLSQFSALLYSLADGFWVAGLGKNALACIGAFLPVTLIITAVYSGFSNAGVSILSKAIGADRKSETNQAGKIIFYYLIFISIGILVFFYFYIQHFYRMMGLEMVLEKAIVYARIMLLALAFTGLNNAFETFLRSEGSTKTIGNISVATSLLNIIIDPIFIYQFQMGLKGAAVASVISAAAGSCAYIYIYYILNNKYIEINLINKEPIEINSRTIFRKLTKLGFSLSLSQLFFSF